MFGLSAGFGESSALNKTAGADSSMAAIIGMMNSFMEVVAILSTASTPDI